MSDRENPYELTFEDRPGYLYARIHADAITEELAFQYLGEVASRCEQTAATRLLLDRDIPDMLPIGSLFFVSAKFQEMIRGVRVAFLNRYQQNADDLDFGTTVGINRGGEYGVFDNEAAARKWLLSG